MPQNKDHAWLATFEWDDPNITRFYPIGIATTFEAAVEVAGNWRKGRQLTVDNTMQEVSWGLHRFHVKSDNGSVGGYVYLTLMDSFNVRNAHEAYTPGRRMVR